MTAMQIPDEVVADLRARPEAYRPAVDRGVDVLSLDGDDGMNLSMGVIGPVFSPPGDMDKRGLLILDGGYEALSTAWVPVGTVDGGPLPKRGGRVIVLEAVDAYLVGFAATWHGVRSATGNLLVDIGFTDGFASSWAVLPDPMTESQGAKTP